MGYYESKYTGAEVDALLDKVNDVGSADWNAQKGEVGYIENKPITKNFIKEQSMEFNEVDEWDSVYAGYDAVPSNTTVARVFADIVTYMGEHITTTVIVKKGESVDIHINKTEEWDYLNITMYDTHGKCTMNVSASFEISGTLKCYYYEDFKQLDEDFIPDTIARKTDIPTDTIKTTPQTLSDDAKNQALANLGIDPVVWKYMMNPLILGEYILTIPLELRDIILGDYSEEFGYTLKPIASSLIKIYNSTGFTSIATFGNGQDYNIDFENTKFIINNDYEIEFV